MMPINNRCGMMKSPEQIQNEINQLMRQYQSTYQTMMNTQVMIEPMQSGMTDTQGRRRGEFIEVLDPDEVEKAPVRMDGSPTLFICFKSGLFWAKKYVNGAAHVTPYSFSPLVTSGVAEQVQESVPDYTKELDLTSEQSADDTSDRLSRLEGMMAQMYERVMSLEPNGCGEDRKLDQQSAPGTRNGAKRTSKAISGDSSNVVCDDQARG